MTKWRRTLILCTIEVIAVLVLHWILISQLAERNVASAILAGGSGADRLTLALAGLFLSVRLLVALGLPGMILARIRLVVVDALAAKRANRSD